MAEPILPHDLATLLQAELSRVPVPPPGRPPGIAAIAELMQSGAFDPTARTADLMAPAPRPIPTAANAGEPAVPSEERALDPGDYGMGAITDNGTGDWTLAVDTAFANTNYWWAASCRLGGGFVCAPTAGTKTTSTLQITVEVRRDGASKQDSSDVGISLWGDYA
jgi:hypothetical protein